MCIFKKERNSVTYTNTFKINSYINNPKKYDVTDLVMYVGNTLLNIDNCTLNIYYKDSLLNRFSTSDIRLEALLDKTALENTYNLYLRTNSMVQLEELLCHELVHLKQYEDKNLSLVKRNNVLIFTWKGKEYPSSTEYWDRPWEQEARAEQYSLWKQFYKYYYDNRKSKASK